MSAHTPGPWSMETVRTSVGICHKVGPFPGKREGDAPRHACLYADYPSESNPFDVELAANARLIVAAPDLLHALAESTGMLSALMDILAGRQRASQGAADEVRAQHVKNIELLKKVAPRAAA